MVVFATLVYLDFNFSRVLEVGLFLFGDRSRRQNRSKCSAATIFYLTAVVCQFLSHVWEFFWVSYVATTNKSAGSNN
jgi:hypothetical protein